MHDACETSLSQIEMDILQFYYFWEGFYFDKD